jgi:uncharacterized protein
MYGKVRNVAAFGIFVDISAFTDGLVHISEIPDYLSSSLPDSIKVGNRVRVKVLDVDGKKRRISLSMKYPKPEIPDLSKFF